MDEAIALLMALKLLGSRKTARLIAAAGTWKQVFMISETIMLKQDCTGVVQSAFNCAW